MALLNLNINFNLILFADDTLVSINEPSNKTLCKSLNVVILNLHEWFTNNRLILNIDKTKVLPYKDANIINSISINSTVICLVSSYTFLGVILDNNLNFKEHIRKIQLKLSHVIYIYIYILRKLSYLPIYILKLLYNSLFLPHIMYCLEIWGNNFNINLQCISTLQKKAVRIVNKNIFKIVNDIFIFTNTNNVFVCSNILKFKDLITYKNILFMQNIHLKKCPSRILLLFPIYNNVYKNTFHNFKLPYIKSSRHRKSLSFKGPKSWNNLCLNKLLFTKMYIKNFKKY